MSDHWRVFLCMIVITSIIFNNQNSGTSYCFIMFWWRFCVVTLLFGFFCEWRGFCHWTESEQRNFKLAKLLAKKEDVEVDTLSEWIKSFADVLKRRIRRLKHYVNTRHESIFSDPDIVTEFSRLHENFVIVPADKASDNYTFVCKRHYISIWTEGRT